MREYISRRQKIAAKKNIQTALFFIILTISATTLLAFFGIPLVIKYVGILSNITRGGEPIEPEDKTPPPPPTFIYFPDSTSEKNIEISGYTEPGTFVDLFINQNKFELVTDSEGLFRYNLQIENKEYKIEALARDKSGNLSKRVYGGKIVYDDTPPELEIFSPRERQEFFGVTEKQITVSGKTEPGTKVNVNGRNAVVSSEGNFNHNLILNEGNNEITVKAEDKAGNIQEKRLNVFYSS